MPLASENASAGLAHELGKKVHHRGLVLWVDAERQYAAFVDALSRKDFGFRRLRALRRKPCDRRVEHEHAADSRPSWSAATSPA
jgi:hypothetical protein